MQHCFLKVKKLDERAKLPAYGSEFAAAADLFCLTDEEEILIAPEMTEFIHTGIAMEIPEGCVGLIYARAENSFDVKFFRTQTQDGKISNILPADE